MVWARKKTGVPVVRVNSGNEASEFLKKHSIFAVGLFEKFEVCAFGPLVSTKYKFYMSNVLDFLIPKLWWNLSLPNVPCI